MDTYTRKKATGGFGFSSTGTSITFKDPNHEDRQYCNRLGCSTRFNSLDRSQIGKPERPKYSRGSFRSTCSKALPGNSSRSFSPSADLRKSHYEREGRTSLRVLSIGESSSAQEDIVDLEASGGSEAQGDSESIPTTTGLQSVLPDSDDTTDKLGTSTTASSSRSCKSINRRASLGNHDTSSTSSFRRSTAHRSTTNTAKPVSHGLKNLSCTSITDVLPSSCSSPAIGRTKRVDTVRKRLADGESSSSRGKGPSGSSNGGLSGSPLTGRSAPSLSLSEGSLPHQSSRRVRNRPASRDGAMSVRTRRPSTGDARTRLSVRQGDDSDLPIPEPIMIPQLSQSQISIPEAVPESPSRSFPVELPPVFPDSFERPGSSNRISHRRTTSRHERNSAQIFHGPLGDRDGYRRFNMEGIAEVLLALERIEQDEELTYEQLLVLETNLFLGGLSFHDQHRDMRMDIDNMSYEELLALEDKMGTVSTALSEEVLAKCLQKGIYMSASLATGITDRGDNDTKCSICQEEYVEGDEVGNLACEHRYHVACVHQWLRLKNWCPICKASACPST